MATFRFDVHPTVSDEDRRTACRDYARTLGVLNALHLQIKELEQVRETAIVLEALQHLHQAALALDSGYGRRWGVVWWWSWKFDVPAE
jgi:hypothetical protein